MKFNQVNSKHKYLNLGCGYRFDPQWTNVNFFAVDKGVIAHDLAQGIPYADNTFELVYHSHVLEHFSKSQADFFIKECYRVLIPGGILRVVVPDFEQITRLYLATLDKAHSSKLWAANYEWISLELFDQLVRNSCGGAMAVYLGQDKMLNKEFVMERYGSEVNKVREVTPNTSQNWQKTIKQFSLQCLQLLPQPIQKFIKAIQIGYYRQSGEIHQWMYDRYSLARLLGKHGFSDVVKRSAIDSYLSNWSSFNLDTEADGLIYKPDSMFMEGVKPSDNNGLSF